MCLLHIRVFFGGKTKRPCFDLFIHWLIKQITNTYRNHFSRSRSYENRSIYLKFFFRVFSKIRLPRKHHFTFSTRKVSNISRSQNVKTSNLQKLVSVTSCAKIRSRMTTATMFSRQNDAGSRERTTFNSMVKIEFS